jgi:hypothetical protein
LEHVWEMTKRSWIYEFMWLVIISVHVCRIYQKNQKSTIRIWFDEYFNFCASKSPQSEIKTVRKNGCVSLV